MRPPGPAWFDEAVTITPRTGRGSFGPTVGAPADITSNVSEIATLVRGPKGDEVTAKATFRFHPDNAPLVLVGSEIAFDDRTFTVLSVRAYRARGRLIYVEAMTI